MFTPEMKVLTAAVVKDKNTKTSTRVLSVLYYMAIRACEIIDWWFPTEYEKRAKACPKGAVEPKTGEAINTLESTATRGLQ